MDAPGIFCVDLMSGPVAFDDALVILSCKCTRQFTLSDCVYEGRIKVCIKCKLQTFVNVAAADDIPKYFDGGEELDNETSLDKKTTIFPYFLNPLNDFHQYAENIAAGRVNPTIFAVLQSFYRLANDDLSCLRHCLTITAYL